MTGDHVALKQANGSAAIYTIDFAFDFDPHIRLVLVPGEVVLGAAGDQAYVDGDGVEAVFEDSGATRALMTATVGVETTAQRRSRCLPHRADHRPARPGLTALEVDPVTKTYVDTQIADLVNGAPETLNQLSEIIAAFESADTDLLSDISGLGVRITALEADPDHRH